MYYKSPDNSLHYLDDDSFLQLLPVGSVPISDEEAEIIQLINNPPPDPKLQILNQIASLEREQLMPRATREFMLLFLEQNNLTAIPGYAPVKAFDEQIKELRDQL